MSRTDYHTVELSVNGMRHRLSIEPGERLLDTLRTRLHMHDVKWGCREGACGACTVLLNGSAVPSCLVLTAAIPEAEIITAAGLVDDPLACKIAQALAEKHAIQCGFCAPGIVVQLYELFKDVEHPSRDEIVRALSGHLCRCGGYELMIDAAASVAEEERRE